MRLFRRIYEHYRYYIQSEIAKGWRSNWVPNCLALSSSDSHCGQIWSSVFDFDQQCSVLINSVQFWSPVFNLDYQWSILIISGQFWSSVFNFDHQWSILITSGQFWSPMQWSILISVSQLLSLVIKDSGQHFLYLSVLNLWIAFVTILLKCQTLEPFKSSIVENLRDIIHFYDFPWNTKNRVCAFNVTVIRNRK